MQFIHARKYLDASQYVSVDCDTQCNVMLTDDINFGQYQSKSTFNYYGGFFKQFPAVITPPHAGYWNITIDVAGANANIRYSIDVVNI